MTDAESAACYRALLTLIASLGSGETDSNPLIIKAKAALRDTDPAGHKTFMTLCDDIINMGEVMSKAKLRADVSDRVLRRLLLVLDAIDRCPECIAPAEGLEDCHAEKLSEARRLAKKLVGLETVSRLN
jgi:hypothetical protein